MCPRSASRPSETSVIAVAPASAASRPARRAPGHQVAPTQLVEFVDSRCATTHIQLPNVRGRPTTATVSPGSRPLEQHGRAPTEIAERRHRDHPLRGADQVAADDARAASAGLLPHAVGQRLTASVAVSPGAPNATTNAVAARTHRLDVGGVLRDGLAADVMRRGPVQPEVPALDQHVGGHHGAAVGCSHHGRVVAGAERDPRRLIAPADQPVDDRELAELARLVWVILVMLGLSPLPPEVMAPPASLFVP